MRSILLVLALLLIPQVNQAAEQATPAAVLELVVGQAPPVRLDAAWLGELPRRTAKAAAHDQPASVWEGVSLVDVLRKAGAPLEQKLRGKALASVVRVTASDGYQVIFTLTELDASFSNANVLLVDTQDGHALGADGPWRLIVPGDKRPARWARSVIRIELVDVSTRVR